MRKKLGKDDLTAAGREDLLYQLADICTPLVVAKEGAVGEVARVTGGTLTAPPVDPIQSRQYFGGSKGFRDIDVLTTVGLPFPQQHLEQSSTVHYSSTATIAAP